MSAQRLSDKKRRRIQEAIGREVTRAWAHGGYTYTFVTPEPSAPERHLHGWFNKTTGLWGLHPVDADYRVWHYNTCAELFSTPVEGSVQ